MDTPKESGIFPAFPPLPAGTNVVAAGIDIESVARVRRALERGGTAFAEKVFTPEETALCRSRGNAQWASFAARWAAKEAFSKALGTGVGAEFSLTDFGVLCDERGAPVPQLSARAEKALRERGGTRVLISLTHARDVAAAIVLFVS